MFLFQLVELGRFRVVVANKKYNSTDNDYEITLEENSTFTVLEDLDMVTTQPTFAFHPLNTLNLLKIDHLYGW